METNSIVHADFYFSLNALFNSFVNFNQSVSSRFAQSFSIRSGAREASAMRPRYLEPFSSPLLHRRICVHSSLFPTISISLSSPSSTLFPSQFNFPFISLFCPLLGTARLLRHPTSKKCIVKVANSTTNNYELFVFGFFATCLPSYIGPGFLFYGLRAKLMMTMGTSTGACICCSRKKNCLSSARHTFLIPQFSHS